MKKSLLILAAAFTLVACSKENKTETANASDSTQVQETAVVGLDMPQDGFNLYGDTIEVKGALTLDSLKQQVIANGPQKVKVYGKVHSTCQNKGCWMKVYLPDGKETMHVMFKDYGFFVPLAGMENKLSVIEGEAYLDTVSVDDLKHFAEDAHKSKAEIDAIKEPKIELSFTASGVAIEKEAK
jgi:hypothetical protein